jgi:AraC-like DNA-binding protein
MEKHRIHFWDRCFFRRDISFPENSMSSSIRRLSIAVVIAANEPFLFRDDKNREESFQGIILGPTVNDASIRATDSHITTFDAFITTPTYRDLLHALDGRSSRPLTVAELRSTQQICRENFNKTLNQAEISRLFDSVMYTLCDKNSARALDPRISKVCALVEKHPANEITIKSLADHVHLSDSRLRALFKQEMQCTLSLYIRNVSAWKTVPMLARGMNFTEAAQEAGFHDLSHYHRAVSEITGGPPSNIKDKKFSVSFGFDPN